MKQLAWVTLFLSCATASAPPRGEIIEVALTVDDLPVHGPLIDGVTRLDLAERMLGVFEQHHLPKVYGFVNGHHLDADASTAEVLNAWVAHGNPLANHGYSHLNINQSTVEQYTSDIVKNERALSHFVSTESVWHLYRYPFLYEGEPAEKRAAVRTFLSERHYTAAPVSIDGDDWAFNAPYARCEREEDRAALRELYVKVHLEELQRMHALTKQLMGRAVPQVLLLHIGVADAATMEALLTAYEREGVRWVELPAALADPFYAIDTAPARFGAALPYRVAKARGVTAGPTIYATDLEERLAKTCAAAK